LSQRLNNFTNWLKQNDCSFALLTEPKNVFYFTGFMCNPHERLLGLAIFQDEEPFLICPSMEVSQAQQSGWQHLIVGYSDHEDPWETVHNKIKERITAPSLKIAIEMDTLSYARAQKLQHMFQQTEFFAAEPGVNHLRNIKDETELNSLREATQLADFAIDIGAGAIKKGKTEQALVAEIEYELKKRGCEGMSFATTVLTGDNTAAPHGHPNDRQIREGDFVLFDLGVVVDGYCSDITRTFIYKHISDEQQRIYETVLKAEEAAINTAKPGIEISAVDRAARTVITDAGYGDFFTHRIGHGLGLDIHEAPSMSSNNTENLETGMVFTIEPGIYVPNMGGVRIEDDIYLGEKGAETLTNYPKTLQIID